MRTPYSLEQLAALLFACEARYALAMTCDDARLWLDATHVARDRLAMVKRLKNKPFLTW